MSSIRRSLLPLKIVAVVFSAVFGLGCGYGFYWLLTTYGWEAIFSGAVGLLVFICLLGVAKPLLVD
jgi:hypothetical protein